MRPSRLIVALGLLAAGPAVADGVQAKHYRTVQLAAPVALHARAYRAPGAVLVPDCFNVRTRLMRCIPRAYVSHDAPGILHVEDGPPHVRLRPYPEVFSWPSGVSN
jgi:hypothetical protein